MLIQAHYYGPVYALLRTCLEHAVVDWLVFQGRTFVQRISNVSEDTWAGWQRERSDGAEWTRMIRDWNRNRKGQVRIVREGLYSELAEDGTRQQISIYYFLLEQYRPELGPPSQQADDGLIGEDRLRHTAEENRALWEVYLTWSSLLINLRENRLVDEEDSSSLGVHYRLRHASAHYHLKRPCKEDTAKPSSESFELHSSQAWPPIAGFRDRARQWQTDAPRGGLVALEQHARVGAREPSSRTSTATASTMARPTTWTRPDRVGRRSPTKR